MGMEFLLFTSSAQNLKNAHMTIRPPPSPGNPPAMVFPGLQGIFTYKSSRSFNTPEKVWN